MQLCPPAFFSDCVNGLILQTTLALINRSVAMDICSANIRCGKNPAGIVEDVSKRWESVLLTHTRRRAGWKLMDHWPTVYVSQQIGTLPCHACRLRDVFSLRFHDRGSDPWNDLLESCLLWDWESFDLWPFDFYARSAVIFRAVKYQILCNPLEGIFVCQNVWCHPRHPPKYLESAGTESTRRERSFEIIVRHRLMISICETQCLLHYSE